MSRFAFATVLAGLATGLALVGCGDNDAGGAGGPTYPYICACNCDRCIERDPATGECVNMGRQDFVAPACAVDDGEADGACRGACAHFGTECTWDAGERASETPC